MATLYICEICNRSFNTNQSLKNHGDFHVKGGHKCTICDKTYNYRKGLLRHFKKCHPESTQPPREKYEYDYINPQKNEELHPQVLDEYIAGLLKNEEDWVTRDSSTIKMQKSSK